MTRDNSGQLSGQIGDIRDIHLVPIRDTRDNPLIGGVPCPEKGGCPGERVSS